jgi:(1->4)-alpha-D-glucan 1-alpha-D-glucosylmutase
LQFSNLFTFGDATGLIPYLSKLGVSHVYASPYFKARPGSAHGYDIVDHNALNPEIGDMASFDAFCNTLSGHGMGQIVDFVPNHMGVGQADNAWWLDVLENGTESPYAECFDIDWLPPKAALCGKVLVPFLGDHYGNVLEAGELKLAFDAQEGTFSAWYYEHRFPITPGEYTPLLSGALARLRNEPEAGDELLVDLELLVAGFRDLRKPARSSRHRSTRRAKATRLKHQLADLAKSSPAALGSIEATLSHFNGTAGEASSFESLHQLLQKQPYRLAFWRVAAEEINYRRFFQINDLAGIRVEIPAVFDAVHQFVLELARTDRIQGLRIDHIDGLFDPKNYLTRLQTKIRERSGQVSDEASEQSPFYVVVEKILAHHEWLREDWPIAGTTGYDFLNRLNCLFIDPNGEASLDRTYERFVGQVPEFAELAYSTKKQAMDLELASELRVLANEFNRLSETSWLTRDHTLVGVRQALREVVACFPVYRTYVDRKGANVDDRRDIDWAFSQARRRSQRVDKTVFDFLYGVLTADFASGRDSPYKRSEVQRLAQKFQQYTGPVMAKGVEDTAFYRYNRLVSLNEVGGEPDRFAVTVSAFHRLNQDQAHRWPQAMLCTSTHDTKRGEDVRVRINVLSEIPQLWGQRVRRWGTLNRRRKTIANGAMAPDLNDEYLFYQTLVGAWPLEFFDAAELDPQMVEAFCGRMITYMEKAVRETKVHSSWINANEEYEEALKTFITRVLDVTKPNPFLADFQLFHRDIAELGMLNGLAQSVLKLTLPGVPDFYQGCEFWDLNLVDPDNRRPVDFDRRIQTLDWLAGSEAITPGAASLLSHWRDGAVKMFVVWKLLHLRQRHPGLFVGGSYAPLDTAGERADHLCCFLRGDQESEVLVVAPRLMAPMLDDSHRLPLGERAWADTGVSLASASETVSWRNVLTDEVIRANHDPDGNAIVRTADLLASFPAAVCVPAR